MYVPASLKRIGELEFAGRTGERADERLEQLAFSLLVGPLERGEEVSPKPVGAAEANTGIEAVRE